MDAFMPRTDILPEYDFRGIQYNHWLKACHVIIEISGTLFPNAQL